MSLTSDDKGILVVVMSLSESGDREIELHNNLVRHTMTSLTQLSVTDQRVIAYLIATGTDNSKEKFPEFMTGNVKDIADACGYKGHGIYKYVRDSMDSLQSSRLRFKNLKGSDVTASWIGEGEYNQVDEAKGTFTVQFTKNIRLLLGELGGFRTVMELETLLGIGGSNYAVRLYQLAKSHQSKGVWKEEVSGLRKKLGVKEGAYTRPYDFRKKVLDYPIAIINDRTDITLSYTKQRHGSRWREIIFEIRAKESTISANLDDDEEWIAKLKHDIQKGDSNLTRKWEQLSSDKLGRKITTEEYGDKLKEVWEYIRTNIKTFRKDFDQYELKLDE